MCNFFFLAGQIGYASFYGELPEFDLKRNQTPWVPFVSSDKTWDTIFSGSLHNLPPLTKLCSVLLEKRSVIQE